MSTQLDERPTRTVADLPDPGDAWVRRAACIGTDPDLFSIGRGRAVPPPAAVRTCRRCPVAGACLIDAVRQGDDGTYRGGMTPKDRERWLARHRITPLPLRSSIDPPRPENYARVEIDLDAVARMRAQSVTWREIGWHFGCSAETAARHWRLSGRATTRVRPSNRVEIDEAVIVQMHAEGASLRAISRALGVSDATIGKRLRRLQQAQAGAT